MSAKDTFNDAITAELGGDVANAVALYQQAAAEYVAEGSPADAEVAAMSAELAAQKNDE